MYEDIFLNDRISVYCIVNAGEWRASLLSNDLELSEETYKEKKKGCILFVWLSYFGF